MSTSLQDDGPTPTNGPNEMMGKYRAPVMKKGGSQGSLKIFSFPKRETLAFHLTTIPAKSLGTLTLTKKRVRILGSTFFCLYGISLNYKHCSRGKGVEVIIFFWKRNEEYKMQRKLPGVPGVCQVLLVGILRQWKGR